MKAVKNFQSLISLLFSYLLFPLFSLATSPPISWPMDIIVRYPSIDAAGTAALKESAKKSERIEYGGCLYQIGDKFMHTQPVTNGKRDEFTASCQLESGGQLVGIFHTHPADLNAHFSVEDIHIANELQVVSYVGALSTNEIIRYIPGRTRTRCPESNPGCTRRSRISVGEFISHLR